MSENTVGRPIAPRPIIKPDAPVFETRCGGGSVHHVAVGHHGDFHGVNRLPDARPIRCSRIPLLQRSSVDAQALGAHLLQSLTQFRRVVFHRSTRSKPHLGRHGYVHAIHDGAYHVDQSVGFTHQRCSSADVGHLGRRASKIEVDHVSGRCEHLGGRRHVPGVSTEDLGNERDL